MKNKTLLIMIFLVFFNTISLHSTVKKKIKLTALNSMQRIRQSEKQFGACEVEIKAARNEIESFQVVVGALDENITIIDAQISDLIADNGSKIEKENIKLFREEYVRVRRSTPRADLPPGLYPDPLIPFINPITGKPIEPLKRFRKRWGEPLITVGYDMYAIPFEVYKGQNQPIWVDVQVPKNVQAGVYRGKFTITEKRGVFEEISVNLTIWDFTLPDCLTHRSYFGDLRTITRHFDVEIESEKFKEIEMRYCEAMAEHRINPPIPHSLLPEVNDDGSLTIRPERHRALKEYIDKLHVTDFEIPHSRFAKLPRSTKGSDYKYISPDERKKATRYYQEYYKYLKKNGWEKRAYVFNIDEPNLRENYEQVLVYGKLIHDAVPEMRCIVT